MNSVLGIHARGQESAGSSAVTYRAPGLDAAPVLDSVKRSAVPLYRRVGVVFAHLLLVALSQYMAFWLRFDGALPPQQQHVLYTAIWWQVALRGVMFVPFRLYGGLWQYTGLSELCSIIMAVALSTVVSYTTFVWILGLPYSRSIVVIDSLLLVVLLLSIRLGGRVGRLLARRKGSKRLLVYGAGDGGEMIVRDMLKRPSDYEPLGFIDDNPAKLGQSIHGVAVIGTRHDLAHIIAEHHPHEILVAMPSADPAAVRRVVTLLQPFKIPISTLPAVQDVLDGRVAVTQIRELTIADLLPRAPIELNKDDVRRLIVGERVLVTGAGGSIGSELSRQLAALEPAALVLFERYENALHDAAYDLSCRFPGVCVHPIIGDVTDRARVNQVMAQYRPHVTFHAAAHKHVPLMEHHPCEAIKNNVIGTDTVARAAERWGVERFILISTDKAVNPSSVMGATKRVAEITLQMISRNSRTRFATVRFGNVLGSNGSVLPRFLEQIRAGGPVTVTHPEIRRFFMLIPEAVQLVLHAAALGEPGMTYVLEMGEQIRLVDLARNLIRLSGYVPEKEIGIEFIGLRPGEKLFEELIGDGETAEQSAVPKIRQIRASCADDWALWAAQVADLTRFAADGDAAAVVAQLRRIVPTFGHRADTIDRYSGAPVPVSFLALPDTFAPSVSS